jgi:hypothetical protein
LPLFIVSFKKAPYTLEELQVRSPLGYEEFSRYDLFIKTTLDDKDLSKRLGSAGNPGRGERN